jgi:hypothetical protein
VEAQFIGVLPALVGHFIEEGFVEEIIHRIAHRAPVGHSGRGLLVKLGDAAVGDGIGFARQPFQSGGVHFLAALVGDASVGPSVALITSSATGIPCASSPPRNRTGPSGAADRAGTLPRGSRSP